VRPAGIRRPTVIDFQFLDSPEFADLTALYQELAVLDRRPIALNLGPSRCLNRSKIWRSECTRLARRACRFSATKGLGEMKSRAALETTMDPARRTLLQVRVEDAYEPTDSSRHSWATWLSRAASSSRRMRSTCATSTSTGKWQKPRSVGPTGASRNGKWLAGEDAVQPFLNLALVGLGRDCNFLTRRVRAVSSILRSPKESSLSPFRRCRSRKTSAISKTEPVLIFSMYSR